MIWYPVTKPFVAFTTTKKELPIELQRAFNENENPVVKNQLWENIYQRIATQLEIETHQLVFAKQTHSDHIAVIDHMPISLPIADTDALITDTLEKCLCIQTADCSPILMIDPLNRAIAAIHSGWKSAAKDIPGKSVLAMANQFGSKASDLFVFVGPCISQPFYEVGTDVFIAFKKLGLANTQLFSPGSNEEKYFFNLPQANIQLLLKSGIQPNHIHTDNFCTFSDSSRFYSARRDGSKTGRIITGIMIRKG